MESTRKLLEEPATCKKGGIGAPAFARCMGGGGQTQKAEALTAVALFWVISPTGAKVHNASVPEEARCLLSVALVSALD